MACNQTLNNSPATNQCKCFTCKRLVNANTYQSCYSNYQYTVTNETNQQLTCKTKNVVYLLTCNTCNIQYVGETKNALHLRMNQHKSNIKNYKGQCKILISHFRDHHCKDYSIQIIHAFVNGNNIDDEMKNRRHTESSYIKLLRTKYPYGLNEKLIFNSTCESVLSELNQNINKRFHLRGTRKNNNTRIKQLHTTQILNILCNLQQDNTYRKNIFCTIIRSKNYSLIRIFKEVINYNISEEITDMIKDICKYKLNLKPNVKEHIHTNNIIIPFHNPAMNYINLFRTFNTTAVKNEFPATLDKNLAKPRILYKYDKPISLRLFNFKNVAMEDIPNTCECTLSPYNDQHWKHIVTADTKMITNINLRNLCSMGTKYRTPVLPDFHQCFDDIVSGIDQYIQDLSTKYKVKIVEFHKWKSELILHLVKLVNNTRLTNNVIKKFNINNYAVIDKELLNNLKEFQKKFIITTTDKANQTFAFICKKFYIETILNELKSNINNGNVYEQISNINSDDIINKIVTLSKELNIKIDQRNNLLPYIRIIPKFHKQPVKFRTIIASKYAATKQASKTLGSLLTEIMSKREMYCSAVTMYTKFYNPWWIINSNTPILNTIKSINSKNNAKCINTYDFSTLYTTLMHNDILSVFSKFFDFIFKNSKTQICHSYFKSYMTYKNSKQSYDKYKITKLLKIVIENTYFTFGNELYRQTIGIPMGTDSAPQIANLFLHAVESEYYFELMKTNPSKARKLRYSFRYIDDLTNINDDNYFDEIYKNIYPNSLELVKVNTDSNTANVLDIAVEIKNKKFNTTIYDKRRSFNFKVTIYPHFSSNLATKIFTNTFYQQLNRIILICNSYEDIIYNIKITIKDLTNRNYNRQFIKNILIKFINNNRNNEYLRYIILDKNFFNLLT